ncbi:unnamed protein product [Knipowitschia caucasica]
MEKRRRVFER